MVTDAAVPVAQQPAQTEQLAAYALITSVPPEKKSWLEKYLLPIGVACLPACIALMGVFHTSPEPPTISDFCKNELAVVKQAKDLGLQNLTQFDDPHCPYRPGRP